MEIRKAKLEEAKEVDNLLTLLIRDEKQQDDSINLDFKVTNFYQNYIDDIDKNIIVALENNKIVGYLFGYIKTDQSVTKKIAVLDALYVLENYRNQKIADKLIIDFKNWVFKNDISNIEVNVCSNNIIAKKLYKKHHFIPFKETLIYQKK